MLFCVYSKIQATQLYLLRSNEIRSNDCFVNMADCFATILFNLIILCKEAVFKQLPKEGQTGKHASIVRGYLTKITHEQLSHLLKLYIYKSKQRVVHTCFDIHK